MIGGLGSGFHAAPGLWISKTKSGTDTRKKQNISHVCLAGAFEERDPGSCVPLLPLGRNASSLRCQSALCIDGHGSALAGPWTCAIRV